MSRRSASLLLDKPPISHIWAVFDSMAEGMQTFPAIPNDLAARAASAILWARSAGSEGGCMREESRAEQEKDLNWHGILGMMALMLVCFGLYGAAVGTYFTLLS